MPLVSMRQLLDHAAEHSYGLPAFNVNNLEQVLLEQGVVDYGDLIVLTIGEPIGSSGGTNTLKIVRVGDHQAPNAYA